MIFTRKSEFLSSRVQYLPLDAIRPNPQQPRRAFDREGLEELRRSIQDYGILQPLTVRRCGGGYELVAGERRLRAAAMAGLRQVPCLIARVDEAESGLLALIENVQRRDLNCFEEAEAIAGLIARYGFSQQEAAARLGRSQSAVANKLRLLHLTAAERQAILDGGLTERHARALLRLTDGEERRKALDTAVRQGLTVARTEALVEELLSQRRTTPPGPRPHYVIKDVRLFLNSVQRSVEVMRQSGVAADVGRSDTEEAIVLTIRIPRKATHS